MPQYDYLYLGDNARAPYGTRSFSETCHRQERFTDIRLMCVHRQRRRQICGLMEKTKNRRKNKKLQ